MTSIQNYIIGRLDTLKHLKKDKDESIELEVDYKLITCKCLCNDKWDLKLQQDFIKVLLESLKTNTVYAVVPSKCINLANNHINEKELIKELTENTNSCSWFAYELDHLFSNRNVSIKVQPITDTALHLLKINIDNSKNKITNMIVDCVSTLTLIKKI